MNLIMKQPINESLLKNLHILTRDGKLNQDSNRKLKQIFHLYQFIEPLLKNIALQTEFHCADLGAGKSYLGFIIYDLFFSTHAHGHFYAIESRAELVEKCREIKTSCHFDRLNFIQSYISDEKSSSLTPEKIDLVMALHACDTATDDAIDFALKKKSSHIVLIPCCQAEVASVLNKNKNASFSKTHLSEIWRHPLHTREFGSTLTNALRSLRLQAAGYNVSVTEFVGLEHSLKNELIIAKYTGEKRKNAPERIESILAELNLSELQNRFLV